MYAGNNLCQYCEYASFPLNSLKGLCVLYDEIITMIAHCKMFKEKQQ